jgi:hypothetical protein
VSSPTERAAWSRADLLRARLAEHGLSVDVDADGALAVLRVRDGAPVLDVDARRAIVRVARECGFTHVALEVSAPPTGALGTPDDAHVRRAEPGA